MKIIVIMKQTFDTEEKIVIENGVIDKENVELIINPYDEYAIEEAVKLKEKHGGDVTVITVGTDEAESALRTALAIGVDHAILVEMEEDAVQLDENGIANVLATVIKEKEFDLILGGNMSVDNGASQVGPRLAEVLNIPHIATITKIEVDGKNVKAERDAEGDVEIIESSLPILVTAQQGLNEPRYPSLPGIMKAKKKPIQKLSMEDLDIEEELLQPLSKIVECYLPKKKPSGRILKGDLSNQVEELVQLLCHEAKVI
ncbi:electron transfer flavoprotein subunit beta/FixA family protein [Bacillus thermocopriae]|uniref:Electron transfer flavoprotein subunit beta n=1 Tax=Neobacillus thermocopriae TaxID=1215031 RepID=A0A6B3TML1_9BACI|nr:electron transfer flavoprotein subunit beta/FixA family protein [Neobacillus thermocopriae]NEX78133.1 electron transfer flavoprotein subunit beta/FixA family protein [Neobacillus thermocopriae]